MPLTLETLFITKGAIAEIQSFKEYTPLSTSFVIEQPIAEKLESLNAQLSILDKHLQPRLEPK